MTWIGTMPMRSVYNNLNMTCFKRKPFLQELSLMARVICFSSGIPAYPVIWSNGHESKMAAITIQKMKYFVQFFDGSVLWLSLQK
jgi:hypothetical protein